MVGREVTMLFCEVILGAGQSGESKSFSESVRKGELRVRATDSQSKIELGN